MSRYQQRRQQRLGNPEIAAGYQEMDGEIQTSAQHYHYRMIVYWSGLDNLWLVQVPELPGCMSDGETPQEAVTNAQVIIQEWIETAQQDGHEIPEPE